MRFGVFVIGELFVEIDLGDLLPGLSIDFGG